MKKIIAIASVFAASTFAAGYGSAGCGLGSVVLGSEEGFVQIFAATTNGTSGNQTFGITSGTSNCTSAGIAVNDMQQEYFAEANFESLQQEMAQGHGENLSTFAALFGQDEAQFSSLVRDNYDSITADNAHQMVANIRMVLEAKNS